MTDIGVRFPNPSGISPRSRWVPRSASQATVCAELGDRAVGGEDPRGLDHLLEGPAADQHQRDAGAVQLEQGGGRVVGQIPVHGVPERAARADHRAVEIGVDDARAHRHILTGRGRRAADWVQFSAFHHPEGQRDTAR